MVCWNWRQSFSSMLHTTSVDNEQQRLFVYFWLQSNLESFHRLVVVIRLNQLTNCVMNTEHTDCTISHAERMQFSHKNLNAFAVCLWEYAFKLKASRSDPIRCGSGRLKMDAQLQKSTCSTKSVLWPFVLTGSLMSRPLTKTNHHVC